MNKKLLFFDIECANCFENKGKICTLGYVLTDDKFNIIEKLELMINPNVDKWDWYVVKNIIGYKKNEFNNKPIFSEAYYTIKNLLTNPDYLVFGSGVVNDFKYLNDDCERYCLERIPVKGFDVQDFYKLYSEKTEQKKLTKNGCLFVYIIILQYFCASLSQFLLS